MRVEHGETGGDRDGGFDGIAIFAQHGLTGLRRKCMGSDDHAARRPLGIQHGWDPFTLIRSVTCMFPGYLTLLLDKQDHQPMTCGNQVASIGKIMSSPRAST